MSAKGSNRAAKRDVIVIDDDEQPAEKVVKKEEAEPVLPPDATQLQQELLKSEQKFKRACEMAGGYKARVEFLENIIDTKAGILVNVNGAESIADLGYCFRNGKLRTIQGDQAFTFTTQEAYNQLGSLIDGVVYEMMEEAGLQKKYIHVRRRRRFLFVSPGYETKKRILCISHSIGEVKAGQWDLDRIINDSLDNGSQLPYIRRALANDWGVVVLNHNEKCEGQQDRCHSSERHAVSEWARVFNEASNDAEIVVVAHSDGGAIISEMRRRMDHLRDYRLMAVALIDSLFSVGPDVFAANWSTSKKKLRESYGVYQLYSGDDTYEGAPAAAMNSVFRMLEGVNVETKEEEFRELLKECERIALTDSAERKRKIRGEGGV